MSENENPNQVEEAEAKAKAEQGGSGTVVPHGEGEVDEHVGDPAVSNLKAPPMGMENWLLLTGFIFLSNFTFCGICQWICNPNLIDYIADNWANRTGAWYV